MPRHCDDWIESFLAFTEHSEAPRIYRKWAAISAISAALKRKCVLNWHTKIYPNMFIALVGPPGGGKGTAIGPALDLLNEAGIQLVAQSITREALIKRLSESTESFLNEEGAYESHCSLTVFSSELAVFLGNNRPEFLSALCDIYDSLKDFKYETISRKEESIKGVYLNLLGGITPSLVKLCIPSNAIGNGLNSRILFVFAGGKGKRIALPFNSPNTDLTRHHLAMDLETIHVELRGKFRVDESFIKLYVPWYEITDKEFVTINQLEGYGERRATHLLKLCMILSASRDDTMIITGETFTRALEYLHELEEQMVKTFVGYGSNEMADVLPKVMRRISLTGTIEFSVLYKDFISDLSFLQMNQMLEALDSIGFCKVNYEGTKRIIRYVESYEDVSPAPVPPSSDTHPLPSQLPSETVQPCPPLPASGNKES
jgi:hypothetical protein